MEQVDERGAVTLVSLDLMQVPLHVDGRDRVYNVGVHYGIRIGHNIFIHFFLLYRVRLRQIHHGILQGSFCERVARNVRLSCLVMELDTVQLLQISESAKE